MAKQPDLLITTTHGIEGRRIVEYRGLVGGDAILGANMFRDMFAGLRDLVGGRSGSYEKVLRAAKTEALEDMVAAARERESLREDHLFVDPCRRNQGGGDGLGACGRPEAGYRRRSLAGAAYRPGIDGCCA